jgi:hypothetical protein
MDRTSTACIAAQKGVSSAASANVVSKTSGCGAVLSRSRPAAMRQPPDQR